MTGDNKQTNKDYEDHLASVHERIAFDSKLLDEVVREATGENIETKEKILKGEANQVFDIVTKGGRKVIVRVSKNKDKQFLQESWAIEQCKKVGVPVPEVLLVKHLLAEGELTDDTKEQMYFSVCIQKKIEGDTLARGDIDMTKLPEDVLANYCRQAGEILAKIHTIPTKGYGRIDQEGKGLYKTFYESVAESANFKKEWIGLAVKRGFDVKIMEEITARVEKEGREIKSVKPVLNHGDYGPKHIMVRDSKIVGILDFGEVRSDGWMYDFCWWNYWFCGGEWEGEAKMYKWLQEGYGKGSLFNSEFEMLMILMKLNLGLNVLYWYDVVGFEFGVTEAMKRLDRDYSQLKTLGQ